MRKYPIITHKLASQNRELQLELWPNSGAGVMLFYPGTMVSPFQYRPLLAALRQAGFTVAALHLVGHGANRHSVGFSFDDLLRNGLDAEEWLRQRGFGPIAVCGHSQGGILTLAHAASSDRILAAFPITAILPQMEEAIRLTHFSAYAGQRARLEQCISALAQWLPRLPIPFQAYLSPKKIFSGARRLAPNRRGTRFTYPLAFLTSLFTARVPSQMRCPLCLFSAQNDALFTPEVIRATFDRLQCPQKRLVWLPGGGHLAAMNPPLCHFIARTAAAHCAGLGLPLRLHRDTPFGDVSHGI